MHYHATGACTSRKNTANSGSHRCILMATDESTRMPERSKITRVVLTNYKSFAHCDVTLGPLTFLVGPNGAGKSNFIDALRFCRDALRTPLDQVFAKRNTNLLTLRRRPLADPSSSLKLRFDFTLAHGDTGYYEFALGPQPPRGFEVLQDRCIIHNSGGQPRHLFDIRSGEFAAWSLSTPAPLPNSKRLYLVNASGVSEFQPVYELLSCMEFYTPDPDKINDLDTTGSENILNEHGDNIASVLGRLARTQPATKDRIDQYLQAIVPGFKSVEAEDFRKSSHRFLNFHQRVPGSTIPVEFLASSMSDGTLRALTLLVALFQKAGTDGGISLVAIEEPEAGLHPGATAVLLDALREASESVQVVVTTHSSDLLDDKEIPAASIRSVYWENGETHIDPVDSAADSALRDRLYTAGELLRMGALRPPQPLPQ
jgi:predicted ATPase